MGFDKPTGSGADSGDSKPEPSRPADNEADSSESGDGSPNTARERPDRVGDAVDDPAEDDTRGRTGDHPADVDAEAALEDPDDEELRRLAEEEEELYARKEANGELPDAEEANAAENSAVAHIEAGSRSDASSNESALQPGENPPGLEPSDSAVQALAEVGEERYAELRDRQELSGHAATGSADATGADDRLSDSSSAETDHPKAKGSADRDAYERPEELVARRAGELQAQIPENSRGRITMGSGVVEDPEGARTRVVSTSEPRGYLRPGVALEDGEIVVPGDNHAETDIVKWSEERKLRVVAVGAGRPICGKCADEIRRVDATPATPLKETK